MRTSFHHQPEAQHPKIFSYPQAGPADYPIFQGQSGKHLLRASISPFDPNATSSHCTAPTRDDPPGRPEKMNIVLLDWLQSVRARNADIIVRSDQRIPDRAARNSSNAAMAVQRWHP